MGVQTPPLDLCTVGSAMYTDGATMTLSKAILGQVIRPCRGYFKHDICSADTAITVLGTVLVYHQRLVG